MILQITAKCSDLCFTTLLDNDGKTLAEMDGYVPEGMGIGGGDYVEITVDLETGKLVDFRKPTQANVRDFIRRNKVK